MNFKSFELCDSHMHLTCPVTVDYTVLMLREIMEHFSYSRIALMSLTTGVDRNADYISNLKAIYAKEKINRERADSVFVYGTLFRYFDERDTADGYLEQLKTFWAMGADGLKLLDGKPTERKRIGKKLSDPIYDKMYAYAEENGIPVTMHIADPKYYWGPKENLSEYEVTHGWWYADGTFPSFYEYFNELCEILDKFPRLKLCVAHCAYLADEIDKLTAFMEKYENASIDLTPGTINLLYISQNGDAWREFLKKYAHRVYFGTDTNNYKIDEPNSDAKYDFLTAPTDLRRLLEKSPDEPFDMDIGRIVPLGLDEQTLAELYCGSHKKLHPHARPIDRSLVLKEAKRAMQAFDNIEQFYETPEDCELEMNNLEKIIEYFE